MRHASFTLWRNVRYRIHYGDTGGLCMDTLEIERFVYDPPILELPDVRRCVGQTFLENVSIPGYELEWQSGAYPGATPLLPISPDFVSHQPDTFFVRPVLESGLCSPVFGAWFKVVYEAAPEAGSVSAQTQEACIGDTIVFVHAGYDPGVPWTRTWRIDLGSSSYWVAAGGPIYSLVVPNDAYWVSAFVTMSMSGLCETQTPPHIVWITPPPQIPSILASADPICIGEETTFFLGETNGQTTQWRWCFGADCAGLAPEQYPNHRPCESPGCSLAVVPHASGPLYVYAQIGTSSVCSEVGAQLGQFEVLEAQVWIQGSTTICSGDTTTLTVFNAASASWTPVTGLDDPYGPVVQVSPEQTTTYTVVAYGLEGCIYKTTVEVRVSTPTQISITPSQPVLCGPSDA
ncbi:MAG: hypothetical protein NZ534_05425, partial [Bacteroidia bacterium]|nr:hypothetical protein [Bacteroidia bacterium]